MGRITASGLSKAYKRYPRKSDRILEWAGFGPRHELHWVLQDIAFGIEPGESVGIVGVNGAGKSTLLKLIAGVMQASSGSVHVEGRVAALLELGMGFHPEFTGRQNAQLSGLLAGMSVDEVGQSMPQIEAFAEIGDYIDQPVRTYSSGMQVRLAFSVATAVRPDILIVDEALAVGDIFFQQKCFERIRGFLAQGTTLLFVSHSAATVYSLCERALLIDAARIVLDGPAREVLDLYNATVATRSSRSAPAVRIATGSDGERAPTVGSYEHRGVEIESVAVSCDGGPAHAVITGSEIVVSVTARFDQAFEDPHLGFQVRDRRGEAVFMTHTHAMRLRIGPVEAGERVRVEYRFEVPLAPGEYSVTAGVADGGMIGGAVADSIARVHDAAAFHVVPALDEAQWSGLCNLRPAVSIARPGRPAGAARGLLITTSHSLLWLDHESGRSRPVHRGAGLYYGMAVDSHHVYVAARRRLVSSPTPPADERGVILVFDHDLELRQQWEAPFPLRDIHEIAVHDDKLWVTCAFDNMVAIRDRQGQWESWYPLGEPDASPRDRNHFNSLAFSPGMLHLLAHNKGESERLEFALPDRRLVARHPLGRQAHNLWEVARQWHTCSSADGSLVGDAGFSLGTGGFPRGIATLGDGSTAVGVSELAERQQRDFTTGAVRIYDGHWKLLREWALPGEGLVLDLKPCP